MARAETTLPTAVVEKMKHASNGINSELDKIQSFGIEIDYDGRNHVKLKGGHAEIHDIAINTLERKYGQKQDGDDQEFVEILRDGRIEWAFRDESSVKFVKLFKDEIRELRKLKTVTYKLTEGKKKLPEYVVISCKLNDFEKALGILKPILDRIKDIEPCYHDVEKKDQTKAVRFCDNQNFTHAFCLFDKESLELKIYGIDKNKSEEVTEEWKKLVKPSQKQTQDRQKTDGTSTVFKGRVENKSVHLKNNQSDSQVSAEMSLPVQGNTSQTDICGLKETKQDKANDVNVSNQNDLSKSTKDLAINSVRSKQDAVNGPVDEDTPTASVSEKCSQHNGNTSSMINQETNFGSSTHGATASLRVKGQPGKKLRDGKYEFMIGKMKVLVYKSSVTELKGMDAIVNAANERMMHGGGVAYFISKAAGKKMDDECYEYIKKNGPVRITENFVSKAGDMKCKGIIHAVGPQWHDYRGRREECARDVYLTVLNCLKATEQRKWKKLALIAISSGIFGVPKQLCAEMYIKAMVDNSMNDPGSITEIHFVDINQDILDIVEKAHKSWVDDPKCLSFQNAVKYEEPTSISGKKTVFRKELKPETSSPSLRMVQRNRDIVHYKVYGFLDLLVYTGSVLDVKDVDAIVCSMNLEYSGGLLRQIFMAAGQIFQQELQKKQSRVRHPKDKQLFILPGGKLKVKQIMAIVIEDYITDTTARDLQRLNDYYEHILLSADEEKMTRLVLPLVGVVDVRDIRSCCKQLIKTILNLAKDVTISNKGSSIKELHLVNYDRNVTRYLTEVLSDMEGGGDQSYHRSSDSHDRPWIDTVKSKGWILHIPLEEGSLKSLPAGNDKDLKKTVKSTTASKSLKNLTTKQINAKCHYFQNCKKMAVQELDCGHVFCSTCVIRMQKGCKVCLAEGSATEQKSLDKSIKDNVKQCSVCLESYPSSNWETLQCGHGLCKNCYIQVQRTIPKCPTCNSIFGIITGNQPNGTMHYMTIDSPLPGYPKVGTIHIVYTFHDGIQKDDHPNPGRPYMGTQRQAYLPDNAEGKKVLYLLRKAFDRRLMFTIGESRSSGKGNRVTFNDIHIKTRQYGGPENYGYPDPDYLTRVQEELRDKGVTE